MVSGPKRQIDRHLKFFEGKSRYIPIQDIVKKARYAHIKQIQSGLKEVKQKVNKEFEFKNFKSVENKKRVHLKKKEQMKKNKLGRLEFFRNKSQEVLKKRLALIKKPEDTFRTRLRNRGTLDFKFLKKKKKKRKMKKRIKKNIFSPLTRIKNSPLQTKSSVKKSPLMTSKMPSINWKNLKNRNFGRNARSLSNRRKKEVRLIPY